MVALTWEVALKVFIALLIVSASGLIFSDLLRFGDNTFQTTIVLSFYVYCFLVLFLKSKHKLFHVLSIPVFTQFLHLFQKYSFAAGANSIWRLLPFLILVTYFILFFIKTKNTLSKGEQLFLLTWILSQFYFLALSPNLPHIAFGGFLMFLVVLPLYFLYLQYAMKATDFLPEMEKYLSLIYIILGLGTFGLIIAGAAYKGSDNLLATRNISDTNVTMAYFILLWPFPLLFFRRHQFPVILLIAMLSILIGVVIFSFSRGAVLIIIPYLMITISIALRAKYFKWFAFVALFLSLFLKEIMTSFNDRELGYFWALRFGDSESILSLMQKLGTSSGRAEIHDAAYALFLKKQLLGHGTGSFEILGPGYREAHSLWYTLLAEQGAAGTIYMYAVLAALGISIFKIARLHKSGQLLLVAFIFYLIFSHSVGSVFVIIPAKSVTINCIAPILLMCLYFYGQHISETEPISVNG